MARLAAAIVGLAFAVAGSTGPAAAQQRELGAHEHGRGTLNIALEGSRLTMELEAPGVDIVGFEHKAKSAKDKAAVANAKKQLAKPLALFKLPAAAGCVVKQAKAKLEGEDDHGHAHGQAGKAKDGKQPAARPRRTTTTTRSSTPSTRSTARAPAASRPSSSTTSVHLPAREKLEVNVITPKGQSKFEVTRAKPRSISAA